MLQWKTQRTSVIGRCISSTSCKQRLQLSETNMSRIIVQWHLTQIRYKSSHISVIYSFPFPVRRAQYASLENMQDLTIFLTSMLKYRPCGRLASYMELPWILYFSKILMMCGIYHFLLQWCIGFFREVGTALCRVTLVNLTKEIAEPYLRIFLRAIRKKCHPVP